jgi:hypothetical protein
VHVVLLDFLIIKWTRLNPSAVPLCLVCYLSEDCDFWWFQLDEEIEKNEDEEGGTVEARGKD